MTTRNKNQAQSAGLGTGPRNRGVACNTIQMGLVGAVADTFLFRGSPQNVKTRRFWPEGHQRYANLAEGVRRQDKVWES